MPRVSIITPLFNGGKFIEANLASVQAQTMGDYEHIVVDNSSFDDGPEKVTQAAKQDPRIRLLYNDKAPGAGPTRNVGIQAAQGDLIAFLDCDDTWRPEKLALQTADMEARDLVFSWTAYGISTDSEHDTRIQHADPEISYEDLLAKRTVIGCLTAIYDAGRIGKRFMNHLPMRQDFCLWLDIIRHADSEGLFYGGLDEPLADYRVHQGGMTSNKLKAAHMQWRAYREHVGLDRIAAAQYFIDYARHAVMDRLG